MEFKMNTIEANLIIDFCNNFISQHRKVYEDTKLGFRYINSMEKIIQRINHLNKLINLHNSMETIYRNKLVTNELREDINSLKEGLFILYEDLNYIKKKISSLSINRKIYDNVIKCENDIHRYKLVLAQ